MPPFAVALALATAAAWGDAPKVHPRRPLRGSGGGEATEVTLFGDRDGGETPA